jgi:NTE family protein
VVNIGHYSAVDFSMTQAQKQALFDIGFKTAADVLPIKLGKK